MRAFTAQSLQPRLAAAEVSPQKEKIPCIFKNVVVD